MPLTLYHLDGLSHEKVARALGVPVGTVRSLVSRARRKLAPMLAAYAREVFPMPSPDDDVFQEQAQPRLLHILNGDCTREVIERSSVPGTFSVWADVLHEGPVPSGLSLEQFREVRARFHADRDHTETYEAALDYHRRWDDGLASFPEYDEVILWFEHDLFDQLILIRHLDYFAGRDMGGTRLSLVCVGEYPGVDRFIGLGQLDPDQLASLAGTRQQVTAGQLDLGRAAWAAFTAPDPTRLERLAREDTSALPFPRGGASAVPRGVPVRSRRTAPHRAADPRGAPVRSGGAGRPFPRDVPARGAPVHGRCDLLGPGEGLAAGPHPLVECEVTERSGGLPRGRGANHGRGAGGPRRPGRLDRPERDRPVARRRAPVRRGRGVVLERRRGRAPVRRLSARPPPGPHDIEGFD